METKTIVIKEKFRRDREGVFRELYEKAFPLVAQFIAGKGGDLTIAKDIFQDAMILYFEKVMGGKLSLTHTPKAYLVGIARNLWYQHCKKQQYGLRLGDIEEPQTELSDYNLPEEDKKSVLDYLVKAGRKCLDLLQAFYYFKTPMKEIAEEFGYRSERSATVQKYKCLEKVRAKVKTSNHAEIIA